MTTTTRTRSTREIAASAVPAAILGVLSGLALIGLSALAGQLEHVLWDWLPESLGTGGDNGWWIFGMLTAVGATVGLVIWKLPGHAGPDPATEGLIATPLPITVVPSLALALVLCLAGGVSLGPENPIIGINVAIAVWLMHRLLPKVPPEFGLIVAVSGTIGAMFGTPVAAALVLTEMKQMHERGLLWDNLFPPLVAAGAGGITMYLLEGESLSVALPPLGPPGWADLLFGVVVALAAALLAMGALYLFDPVHRLFHRLPNPLITLTVGGTVLGGLGAIYGEISLFKGLTQMQELAATASDYSTGDLFGLAVVKLAAMVVAATAGFRGGRIFPVIFVSVAFGLGVSALFPSVPPALAVGCAILGIVLVVSRDGWMALFLAAAIVGDVHLLPLLCLTVLPVWLLVAARPDMVAKPAAGHEGAPA
ncbi:MAG TPA: ion channel protein [Aldersonia sp.]